MTSNTGNHNQAIDVVYSSTAQYKEDYLEKFGCAPNGGFIKDKGAAEEDCAQVLDCELFESKCCEKNSGLLMAMAFCVESPNVYVTAN